MVSKYSYKVWEHFPDQENPFLETFFRRPSALISESSPLISSMACMPVWVVLWDSGTPLERSAAKNYANPRYKCGEISDFDPIGDKNHNEGNPQFCSPLIGVRVYPERVILSLPTLGMGVGLAGGVPPPSPSPSSPGGGVPKLKT